MVFVRKTESDKLSKFGCGREGVGVSSEQPSEVGGARGWISTTTSIGPCGEIGDASCFLRVVGREHLMSVAEVHSEI